MKNGTLRLIPLQSDLCLNKQKVDISDFKGWQKCNAPVYGDCLSPLYKKNETHHDIFIGNDTYDFSEGKLYKNGTEVLSGVGSKKLKKTKISENYSSLKVTEDGLLSWCKETGSAAIDVKLGNNEIESVSITGAERILATKCFGDSDNGLYGCVVLYLHTSGKHGYYLIWYSDGTKYTSYGENSATTLYEGWEVVAPLIQVGIVSDNGFVISMFGNSGANISETQVKNVAVFNNVVYDNPVIKDDTLYPDRYETEEQDTDIHFAINTTNLVITGRDYNATSDGAGSPCVSGQYYEQTIWAILSQPFGSDIALKIEYENASGTLLDTGWRMTVPAGQTVVSKQLAAFIAWSSTRNAPNKPEPGGSILGRLTWKNGNQTFFTSDDVFIPPTVDPDDYYTFRITMDWTSTSAINDPSSPGQSVARSFRYYGKAQSGIIDLSTWYSGWSVGTKLRETSGDTLSQVWSRFESLTYNMNVSKVSNRANAYPMYGQWGQPGYYPSYVLPSFYTTKSGTEGFNVTAPSSYGLVRYKKTLYQEDALKNCDCVLDDGRFYCVGPVYPSTTTELPQKLFALAGTFKTFTATGKILAYDSVATFNIGFGETGVYPRYWAGMSISLQDKYLRILYKFKSSSDSNDIIYFGVDSSSVYSATGKNIYLYPGVNSGSDTNLQGGCVDSGSAEQGWRLLFNTNLISNIACYEKKGYIGTTLADWFSIDTDFSVSFNSDKLYYRDNNNTIWLLEMVSSGEGWQYKVIENRYIVLNTTNYFNCYDTFTGEKRHWASDYNNRVMFGYSFTEYSDNALFTSLLKATLFNGLLITGQNANFEQTKDTITSLELGAILYGRCLKDFVTFVDCGTPYGALEGIDLYRGDNNSTAALYICSYSNGLKYVNTDLTNPAATYPIPSLGNIRYNPNLFTQFISSYNNKDMVISDNVAYKLLYFNNVVPIMSYYLLDGVEGLENAFVLQSSYYGVSKTRLYQMNYSNGVGVEVVCDITNMEYLGALPTKALFWSAQNRAIYSFTGSCIMQLTQYANDLTEIYGKWYNPATQELFLDTNIGILVFSDLGTYCLEWETETDTQTVSNIFFFDDYFIVNLIGGTEYSHYYSYNNKEGYVSNGIYFITKYYGNGLVPITVNNIFVRLYNQGVVNAEGVLTMKGHTITDIGVQTDTKTVEIGGTDDPTANPPEVAGEQWDPETGTMLIKYTPQFNRGLGFALELSSTFPIIDIKFDYVQNGAVEGQLGHVNI